MVLSALTGPERNWVISLNQNMTGICLLHGLFGLLGLINRYMSFDAGGLVFTFKSSCKIAHDFLIFLSSFSLH